MTLLSSLLAWLFLQHAAGMPFDQQQTSHHFRLTQTGGVISVTVNDATDTANLRMIRSHLQAIAADFARGTFDAPFATHGELPSGAAEMRTRRREIVYRYAETGGGGEVRITASTPAALDAVHAFLRYQIRAHATGDPLTVASR